VARDADVDVAFADEGGYVGRGEKDAGGYRSLVILLCGDSETWRRGRGGAYSAMW
jgi:hypothetical protein